MIIKDTSVELVVTKNDQELTGYRSVYFRRPAGFVFEAGDWIDIGFKSKTLAGGITYTISSSPTESDLRITFREGISEIKRALQSVNINDSLIIRQYGNDYDFRIKTNQQSTFIAGGVGIAPFRSMIKEMYDNKYKNEVTLIYLNQNENFLFRDELDLWSHTLPNIRIHYISTKELNRKKRDKLVLSFIEEINQNFYISGPPSMVDTNEHLLIDNGINIRDIRIDSFGGYQ